MDINFNETHVFTYDPDGSSIGIWKNDETKGRHGIPVHFVGWINFYDLEQMNHFKEMIEFALEKQKYI